MEGSRTLSSRPGMTYSIALRKKKEIEREKEREGKRVVERKEGRVHNRQNDAFEIRIVEVMQHT